MMGLVRDEGQSDLVRQPSLVRSRLAFAARPLAWNCLMLKPVTWKDNAPVITDK